MTWRLLAFASVLALGCGARQSARTSESIFTSPAAEVAQELAPDLYEEAKVAAARAEEAQRRKDEKATEDSRTESRLWFAAAVAEAERIQLDRLRDEIEREEERWAKQLARDQEASAVVAEDISRYQAQAVALREAERVSGIARGAPADAAAIDAIVTRARLNLALAEALGATEAEVGPLRSRVDAMAERGTGSAQGAEGLLRDTEALIGAMRAEWPAPRPGASIALVETATASGFAADRAATGVVVRSGRFFGPDGKVSAATLKRFRTVAAAFPHGPIGCQVAVPNDASRVWARRVAELATEL
ncbi:MAG: hypothetical protein AMJ62_09910, partial [Myxococcales bacterium SG8_38]